MSLKKRLFAVNAENIVYQYVLGNSKIESNTNTFNESIFGHLKQLERQKGSMRPDFIEGLILYKMNGISSWLSNLEKTKRKEVFIILNLVKISFSDFLDSSLFISKKINGGS
jgi:hypothetical protein